MDWEFSFLYFLQELHNPVLDNIMVFITSLGNSGLLWIGLAVGMLFFKKYRVCAISIGIALVFKELLGNVILKELIMRERPCWIDPTVELLVKSPSSFSFPSGHTAAAFSLATSLSITYPKWYVIAPSAVWACGVGLARINQGVHYPSDVLTGAAIGVGCAFVNVYVNRWLNKLLFKQ